LVYFIKRYSKDDNKQSTLYHVFIRSEHISQKSISPTL
jgi:hypothetical protein